MNRRKILFSVLFVLALTAALLSGCNSSNSTPDEADTSVITTVSTAQTEAFSTKAEASAPLTQKETEKAEKIFSGGGYDSDSFEDETAARGDLNEDDGICTLNVDGKTYTFKVGDTLSYSFYLKTPEMLEDFQAVTNYDSGMLKLLTGSASEMFPIAGNVVIFNGKMPNKIMYNAVNINGMDFTSGGVLASFDFRVTESGGTAISTTLEYMDSVKSEPYVSDYKIIGDITYSEIIN